MNSRLYRPPIRKTSLFRSRLNIDFVNNSYPIYLVVASTGYGKTELVSQWVEITNRKCCWISLEESHNNLKNVIYDLGNCLLDLGYEQGHSFISVSENLDFPNSEFLLARFEEVFYSVKEPVVLVFDDLHRVSNKTVKDFILSVSLIFSKQITKSLVLISHQNNDLDYSRLINYNKIHITTSEVLKFNLQETEAFISKRNFENSSSTLVHEFQKKCEGWILLMNYMVYTIGLSPSNRSELTLRKRAFQSIVDQEWGLDSNELKKKFRLLCFTHKFSKELYVKVIKTFDSVISREEISTQFDDLTRSIPYIIPLDDNGHWFRLHHYIQDQFLIAVKRRYAKEEWNNVLNVVADFFEEKDLIEDALLIRSTHGHHLKSVDIIKRHWIQRLNSHQLNVLKYWIGFIPAFIQINHLEILFIRAILHDLYNDGSSILNELDIAEVLLRDLPPNNELWGNYFVLKSMGLFYSKEFQSSLICAEKGMKIVSSESTWFSGFGLVYYLMSLIYLSPKEEIQRHLLKLQTMPSENSIDRMNKNIIMAANYLILGDFSRALLHSKSVTEVAKTEKHNVVFVMANYFIAKILYLQNKVEEALIYIDKNFDREFDARPLWIIHSYWLKMLCLKARDASREILNAQIMEFELYINRYSNPFYTNYKSLIDLEIRFMIKKQHESHLNDPDYNVITPTVYLFYPEIIEINSNISSGNFQEALKLVNYYENELPYYKNYLFEIRLRICKAICFNELNEKSAALNVLESLLMDTEKNQIIQEYLRYDTYLYPLFKELMKNTQFHSYIRKVAKLIQVQVELGSRKTPRPYLNNRELEILQLIKAGFIDKEIAERLNLSYGTIKTYNHRLYKKLKVKNRKDAITVYQNSNL